MAECVCGARVADHLRTCPQCGRELNPEGADQTIQDQKRSTTVIAELRQQARDLTERTELAERRRTLAEDNAAHLRESLAELAEAMELLTLEQRQLRERLHDVEERSRIFRVRFEALGVSTYRPFSASQAPMFGPAIHSDGGSEQAG